MKTIFKMAEARNNYVFGVGDRGGGLSETVKKGNFVTKIFYQIMLRMKF